MSDLFLYPDVEEAVVEVLKAAMPSNETATVGVNVPSGWTKTSPPRIQVRDDFPDAGELPVAGRSTVSLIARAATTREAKRIAALAQAVLVARTDLISATALTGPLAARDPETNAELATTTVEVVARSTRPA